MRHYSLFSLMSPKLTLFTLFLIFETLFIIFVKLRHYLNLLDIICQNRYEFMQKVLVLALKYQFWFWTPLGLNLDLSLPPPCIQMGHIRFFVANQVTSWSRAFLDIFFKNRHYFSNFRHYCCNFGRHYLFNFQITGLLYTINC